MARRYLAFDIETAKEVAGDDFNWRPHRPLGISCAATLASVTNELRLWHGKTSDGAPAGRMTREDAAALVQYLADMISDGFTILTWNGLGFDFDILAEESAAAENCGQCALAHIDMMFHIVCSLGYPVALEKDAQEWDCQANRRGWPATRLPSSGRRGSISKFWIMSPRTCGSPCGSHRRLKSADDLNGPRAREREARCRSIAVG